MVKKEKNIVYYEAVGRRKSSVALVRLYLPGKDKTVLIGSQKMKQGEVWINRKPAEEIFPALAEKVRYLEPYKLTANEDRFVTSILVNGGGKNGQLEAVVLGIARALEKTDRETVRPLLKKQQLLTRDPRVRERRKVGTGGKARRAKQSPKR